MTQPSVLFVSKRRDDPFAAEALAFAARHFPRHEVVLGKRGERLPDAVRNWSGDYLISYLSPWILPQSVLDRAKVAAINFHPGPPEYPGVGCYNFALYQGVPQYGITCHHMAAKVDTGRIIAVRRFPVFPSDDVASLVKRTGAHLLMTFYEVMACVLRGEPLPESDETWRRKPYTTPEMEDLFRVHPGMSAEEVARRVRAAEYAGWQGAYVEVGGRRFYHERPA